MQTRCDEPGCGAKSPSPQRAGWMKVWKVGHKDEAKIFCPAHGAQRGFYLFGKPGRKPKNRVDTWQRPQGRPIEPMPF